MTNSNTNSNVSANNVQMKRGSEKDSKTYLEMYFRKLPSA